MKPNVPSMRSRFGISVSAGGLSTGYELTATKSILANPFFTLRRSTNVPRTDKTPDV
jgi:hypothetical protein